MLTPRVSKANLIASHHQFWFRRNRRNHGLVKIIQIQPVCHRSDQPIVVCKQIAVQSLCILGGKYTFWWGDKKSSKETLIHAIGDLVGEAGEGEVLDDQPCQPHPALQAFRSTRAADFFMTWTRTWAYFLRLKILSWLGSILGWIKGNIKHERGIEYWEGFMFAQFVST